MDYVLTKNRELVDANTALSDRLTIDHCRNGIEYSFMFMLAYMWNRNFDKLPVHSRESLAKAIRVPTIGSVLEICRQLDCDAEYFGNNQPTIEALSRYPRLRNQRIGHGYLLDDDITKETVSELDDLLYNIAVDGTIIRSDFDIVIVQDYRADNNVFIGRSFKSDGTMVPWQASGQSFGFQSNNIYAMKAGTHEYSRLSPFITIDRDDFFFFVCIQDPMTGRAKYNQALRTGTTYQEWSDFTDDISDDGKRRKSPNGTILNSYDNNYKEYIDLGSKKDIKDFVENDRSSVCAVIWGHGGVGKTSTVQSICEDLSRKPSRPFDYIVFASAKDRAFDYRIGEITLIDEPIDSYVGLLNVVGATLSMEESEMRIEDEIRNIDRRLLIVIDDYETFREDDRASISEFIRTLNVDHHKVVVTTRANVNIGGLEIRTDELTQEPAADFLVKVMESQFGRPAKQVRRELGRSDLLSRAYEATGGRPLFILYLAHVWAEEGRIDYALGRGIGTHERAIEFLFGRVYEYLSREGKRLFAAISLLVTKDDLENLMEKLRFIVNMNEDDFGRGMEDLVRLRIVERFENGFFRVYSAEIVDIMSSAFDREPRDRRGAVVQRLNMVTNRKDIDTERALLENANRTRQSREEIEVVDGYRQILKRKSSPDVIRLRALLNLAEYLFNNRDRKENAVAELEKYREWFREDASFNKIFANYYWAVGRRQDAIGVLREYLRGRRGDWPTGTSMEFEFLGLALMYESVTLGRRAEELDAERRFAEIDSEMHVDLKHGIRRDLKQIHDNSGVPLLDRVKELGLRELSPAARQNVVSGLDSFSSVCVQVGRYTEVCLDICGFVIDQQIPFLKESFEKKLGWLRELRASKKAADRGPTLVTGDRYRS